MNSLGSSGGSRRIERGGGIGVPPPPPYIGLANVHVDSDKHTGVQD